MSNEYYEYLKKTFTWSNHIKYRPLFEEWVKNITLNQHRYYLSEMQGGYGCWFKVTDNDVKKALM